MRAAEITARIRSEVSFKLLFSAIFFAGLALRLISPDLKLLHHDEAVHAWFSYRLLSEGAYVYDPSYHGPFLYYVTAGAFALMGDSDLTARLLPAITGAALVALIYPLYRMGYLDRSQTLVAALFLAVSPDMVYFSRFLRHDIFQLFFTLLLLVGLIAYLETGKKRYGLLAAASAAFGVCCKEDMPLILLIFLLFGIYLAWKGRLKLPVNWKSTAMASIVLFTGICALLYSSFGLHPEVLVGRLYDISYINEQGFIAAVSETGWYKAAEHWLAMHGICRICGPWFFYVILFILYELPILALASFGTAQFLLKDIHIPHLLNRFRQKGITSTSDRSFEDVVKRSVDDLKRKSGLSGKRMDFFRFCIFWMILTLAIYAWIGEKVPWLILHQLLPMTIVAVYGMTPRRALLALASTAFLILLTWHVAFVPADVNEPIVQVQNSEDLRVVMRMIDASEKVAIASKNYWPLPWYYRGEKAKKLLYFGRKLDEEQVLSMDADLIITYDAESYEALYGYEKQIYKNNYWFSYHDQKDRLIEYYLFRDGKMGSMNWDIFVRNSTA
ncbi:MAG: TIGR03663 family protein [Methanomicrobiales archaeon]|nr:TIGR03663 family protein [Methanomicrobiales archaeon]